VYGEVTAQLLKDQQAYAAISTDRDYQVSTHTISCCVSEFEVFCMLDCVMATPTGRGGFCDSELVSILLIYRDWCDSWENCYYHTYREGKATSAAERV